MKTVILASLFSIKSVCAILYPRDSESRQTKSLDGIWNFKLSSQERPDEGFEDGWYRQPLQHTGDTMLMAVPSSYNDITTDSKIRDFVGWAWYGRTFYIPSHWQQNRVFLRFGSVHYTCNVFINGQPAMNHSGGHIPFEADVSELLLAGQENHISVAVNNTLTRYTVPQGSYTWHQNGDKYPPGYFTLDYNFDFFNYAGIHRPVVLYTTPRSLYIEDIRTASKFSKNYAEAEVDVEVEVNVDRLFHGSIRCTSQLIDAMGKVVGSSSGCRTQLTVSNPNLWWPYLMSESPGYLYTLKVTVSDAEVNTLDTYALPIGLREVTWDNSNLKINGKKFYFRGFGRHEDSNIRGKGLDLPLVLRDYNLIQWLGANSYRTSHYPYADEIMDIADRLGIVIIDECPAVALDHFDGPLLKNHLQAVTELVARDKNRPSVVMWSVGNEPRSYRAESGAYFGKVYNHTRQLDSTRPITLVINADYKTDHASQHFDVIAINRYFGWYSDTGHLELIENQTLNDLRHWRQARGKPVMLTEYGADTISGLHMLPSMVFTEEYQAQLMLHNFKAFDIAKKEGWFIGEMIWNFADFMTKQEDRRVAGNKKGIFTRDRQPKLSAHILASRYWHLAQQEEPILNGAERYLYNTNMASSKHPTSIFLHP